MNPPYRPYTHRNSSKDIFLDLLWGLLFPTGLNDSQSCVLNVCKADRWAKAHANLRDVCEWIVCVAWQIWLGALNKKGGRGKRKLEEIGAGATWKTACTAGGRFWVGPYASVRIVPIGSECSPVNQIFWSSPMGELRGTGQIISAKQNQNIKEASWSCLACQHFISDRLGKLKPNKLSTELSKSVEGDGSWKGHESGEAVLIFLAALPHTTQYCYIGGRRRLG